MKFTCDSCGAQYLIADEKIGARGVKVRCKKCSHVIILRPSELATSKPEGTNGNGGASGPMTGGSAASVPVAPSVAALQAVSPSMLPNDVVAATSSDLGLSQEFKALGFDEPGQAEPRAATLSVGLDLQSTPSVHGDTSPFSAERAGGSLDLVPHESEATAVQPRPGKPFADEETEMIGDPEGPSTPSLGDLSGAVGLGQANPEIAEDEEASTRVENLEDLAASEAASGVAHSDVHEEEDATLAFNNPAERSDIAPAAVISHTLPAGEGLAEPGSAEAGLGFGAAFNDAPLEDMRSSLEAEMDSLSDSANDLGDDLGANTVVAPSPVTDADFDAPIGGADALAALAQDEDEPESEASTPPSEAPSIDGLDDGLHVAGLGETPFEGQAEAQAEADAEDDDDIAGEIGSAFEAMFAGDDGGGGGELEALQEALGAEGANKAETRVFDTEAMAKVEAEQDRAEISAEHEAVQAKEWFVAIEEEQIGPLSKSEVQAHWDDGKLEPDSLCWRAGMGDWTAIQDTEPLADIVPPAPEPRVPIVIGGDVPDPAADDGGIDDDLSALSAAAKPTPPPPPPDIKPEPEPVAAPRAASEPAWRPSAASALASLAAEELSDDAPSASAPAALGAAPTSASPSTDGIKALAASDALEKLLEGEPDKSAASQFGAAEQSESMVRPLPRRADTVSSLPLRDPTADKPKSKGMLYAVVGGFAFLILAVLGVGMMLKGGDEPAKTPGAVAQAGAGGLVAAPGDLAAERAAEAKKAAEAKALEEAEALKAAEAKALAEAEALKAEEAKKLEEAKKVAKKPRKRGSRRRRRTTPKREPSPEIARASNPDPIRAAAPKRSGSAEDDLLGAAAPRRRLPRRVETEPELPDQLDDSDVLSVLRSNRRDVKRCLKAQASADPSFEGTMTVELVIRRSGRPKGVRVREDKFKRSAVGTCMTSAVKKWRFPKFSGKAMPLDFPVRVRAR